jgi:hypothetical protein
MSYRTHALVAFAVSSALALTARPAAANIVYDFSSVPGVTTTTPYTSTPYTLDGATFSSPSDPGAFTFGANGGYSTLGAYTLSSSGVPATLDISFSNAQNGIAFDAATGDFFAGNGSDAVTLTEFNGATQVGTQTLSAVIPTGSGDYFPQVAFNLVNQPNFTSVAISAADGQGPEALTIADLETAPVPLPGALLLFASGLGGIGVFRRRRANLTA